MTSAPTFPIVIRLAGIPQGKGRPRFARASGRAFTPAKTRSYEACLRMAAQDVMGDVAPVDGALFVTISAAMPVPASWSCKKRRAALAGEIWPTVKPDTDNLAKVVDALNEVVFRDDKQIVVLTVVKSYSDKPEMKIIVREAIGSVRQDVAPPIAASPHPPIATRFPQAEEYFTGLQGHATP